MPTELVGFRVTAERDAPCRRGTDRRCGIGDPVAIGVRDAADARSDRCAGRRRRHGHRRRAAARSRISSLPTSSCARTARRMPMRSCGSCAWRTRAGRGAGTHPDRRRASGRPRARTMRGCWRSFSTSTTSAPAPSTTASRAALTRFVDDDVSPRDLVVVLKPLDSLLAIRAHARSRRRAARDRRASRGARATTRRATRTSATSSPARRRASTPRAIRWRCPRSTPWPCISAA